MYIVGLHCPVAKDLVTKGYKNIIISTLSREPEERTRKERKKKENRTGEEDKDKGI